MTLGEFRRLTADLSDDCEFVRPNGPGTATVPEAEIWPYKDSMCGCYYSTRAGGLGTERVSNPAIVFKI